MNKQKNQERKRKNLESKADLVVSTIHGAKGLEFDNVVVLYKEDPKMSQDTRRMFYVAFTRAMKSQYVLSYGTAKNPPIQSSYEQIVNALTERDKENAQRAAGIDPTLLVDDEDAGTAGDQQQVARSRLTDGPHRGAGAPPPRETERPRLLLHHLALTVPSAAPKEHAMTAMESRPAQRSSCRAPTATYDLVICHDDRIVFHDHYAVPSVPAAHVRAAADRPDVVRAPSTLPANEDARAVPVQLRAVGERPGHASSTPSPSSAADGASRST